MTLPEIPLCPRGPNDPYFLDAQARNRRKQTTKDGRAWQRKNEMKWAFRHRIALEFNLEVKHMGVDPKNSPVPKAATDDADANPFSDFAPQDRFHVVAPTTCDANPISVGTEFSFFDQ
jgi:hypothetical protein